MVDEGLWRGRAWASEVVNGGRMQDWRAEGGGGNLKEGCEVHRLPGHLWACCLPRPGPLFSPFSWRTRGKPQLPGGCHMTRRLASSAPRRPPHRRCLTNQSSAPAHPPKPLLPFQIIVERCGAGDFDHIKHACDLFLDFVAIFVRWVGGNIVLYSRVQL
jgi:hypothetical protein